MNKIKNIEVAATFKTYPQPVRNKLYELRQLLLETAIQIESPMELQETLKWNEPSYLTKNGSTIRMAWKKSKPDHYALYFNCQTKLVATFKILYKDLLTFEGTRAIVFHKNENIPIEAVAHCISLALNYHKIKHLPRLGS